MSKWNKIETAPRDGTWLMLWRPCEDGPWRSSPLIIARWDSTEEEWAWPEECDPWTAQGREKADDDIESGDGYASNDFTHWMPLPVPPEQEA